MSALLWANIRDAGQKQSRDGGEWEYKGSFNYTRMQSNLYYAFLVVLMNSSFTA